MELINATRMPAAYNIGLEPSGRELLVVVIKGTFCIPREGEPAGRFALHEQQVPLIMADTFAGEPGLSAPINEADFAAYKPACDILLNGSVYAPHGRATARVEVAIQIAGWSKRFAAVGARHWDCSFGAMRATPPQPFVKQPVSYNVAFGGADLSHDDPAQHAVCVRNPAGTGFHKNLEAELIDNSALPLTEELGRGVTDTVGDYLPMAFGPVGRSWEPRVRFAGTYDETWLEHHFPFLPPDFDRRYYQSAPVDQQLPPGFFDGGAQVVLTNLTPDTVTRFDVPGLRAPVAVFPRSGPRENYLATLDTLLIEPDDDRFCLTWRLSRPLRRNIFEIARVQVGKKGRELWQEGAA